MSATLKRQIDSAWRELVKGEAADDHVIEAALAAARKAQDTSVDHVKLAERYFVAKAARTPRTSTKEAATGRKSKSAPKKKPPKNKASTRKAVKRR